MRGRFFWRGAGMPKAWLIRLDRSCPVRARALWKSMAVLMRLISLVLIVVALMLLGADAVTSLERGGVLTARSLDTIWGLLNKGVLDAFKSWVQNHAAFMAQFVYSTLAIPGWAVTGVIGVILAFIFGRKLGPE
jgi:hypothetical protein